MRKPFFKIFVAGLILLLVLSFAYFAARYYGTIPPFAKKANSVRVDRNTVPISELAENKKISLPLKKAVIKVYKSKRELKLYDANTLVKIYPVSLGSQPDGDKKREGDGKTPEGVFYISQKAKNPDKAYLGSRWMRISYPEEKHAAKGLENKLIDKNTYNRIIEDLNERDTPPQNTKLGGGIGIHGGTDRIKGGSNVDWTAGCIALYDEDTEEIYDQVKIGTKVFVFE